MLVRIVPTRSLIIAPGFFGSIGASIILTRGGDVGMLAKSSTPQELADLLRTDTDEWRRLIKQIGFTADS